MSDSQPYDQRASAARAFREHVNRGKVETYERMGFDVLMGEREGCVFRDAYSGRELINCHGNGGVFNLGHRNPRVLAALSRALEHLDIGNHHLISGWRARLAERLVATTGGALSGVVFAVAGGEAVDLAIKVARARTGRRGVVSARGGYHGHTGLAMATGDEQYLAPFGPRPEHFSQVPFDDIDALERAVDDHTAAVILEPIPATLGMPIPRPGYLAQVARVCRERGAVFIVDEVQTGLGRTGRVWAYQHEGVEPDVLVTGKGLSGGLYPIAATLMTRELHALFDRHPFVHISTFGGAELGCAVALEVLEVLEEPGFLERVTALGQYFQRELGARQSFTLRQRGLFMGLAFKVAGAGMFATKALYDAGVFAIYANNDTSVLQLLPPLTIDDATAERVVRTVTRLFP